MYKLVFLTVIVAIILLVPISLSEADWESQAGNQCISDTDGGKNFLKAGTVIGQSKNHTDICSPINDTQENLIEYSCKFSGSEYGSLAVTNQDCSQLGPYTCLDGACVSKNASAVNQSSEIGQTQKQGPVVVYTSPETSPVTATIPQMIGTTCQDVPDGAEVTNPLTKQKTKYGDFDAEAESVKYDCSGNTLTITRTPKANTTQNQEPERLEIAERRKVDLPQNHSIIADDISTIIKNELPSLLLLLAQPNAMFVSMAGGVSTYCKDTDTTIDGNSDNPFEQGTAVLVIKGQQKERKIDICGDELDHGVSRYVLELVCKPGGIFSNPKTETVKHDCLAEFGAECFEGACYQFEPLRKCFDSDAGNQPTENGWVIPQQGGQAVLDRCSQPSSRITSTIYKGVLERECRRDGTVGTVDINCGTGRRCENPGDIVEDACTSQWAE
ncbi:MAG: hypothetical protein HY512_01060 [Candidatus Aenigmarchaeota archaeon]|nr:hypothetical protein [Candidatus Aenigmarchaeota archaeon]